MDKKLPDTPIPFGHTVGEGDYVDGVKHGRWVYWFDNGNKAHEGEYKNGKRHGLWTSWYRDGGKSGECFL